MVSNKSLIFKSVPSGYPVAGKDVVVEESQFDENQAAPSGGVTLKYNHFSFDPYMRGRMREAHIKSYAPAFDLGKPITSRGIATVLKSDNDKYKSGDVVVANMASVQEYAALNKETVDAIVQPLDNPHKIDPKVFLGALGMPGLTAYSSLYDIGKPKKGEVIFISSAAGAVGQLVGQIAKHEGLKVIGSAGEDEKVEFITKELGFDAAFNYKKENTSDALKKYAPEGIDIYYENVGGETLEAAISALNEKGRIVACGMISQYNLAPEQSYGVKNLMMFVTKRLEMRGFIVGDKDMGPKYAADFQKNVQEWVAKGQFKPKSFETVGMDNAPDGLVGIFKGQNFGKAVLTLAKL